MVTSSQHRPPGKEVAIEAAPEQAPVRASGRAGRDRRRDGAADLGADTGFLLLAELGLAGPADPLCGGEERADGPSGPPPPGPRGPARGLSGGDGHPDLGVVDGRTRLSVAPLAASGLVLALATHALLFPPRAGVREKELSERVGSLTRSRRSVLEIQELELRRVERDLHDGAQARLVSLGMSLGLAEQMMEADPAQARRLLTDARTSAGAALSDLRDLVRGIHPPVLADRGLEGAIRALVVTVPLPVEVAVDLPPGAWLIRSSQPCYFAVAESIANVVKHSQARQAWIRIEHTAEMLCVVIGDDGRGRRRPGSGTGLSGVANRLAAFDGTLSVVSPHGGPTVLRVEVPCEQSSQKT